MQNPSLDYGADTKIMVHGRLVQPLLDMTLFFLGLPIVLGGRQRSVFVVAGQALGMVVGFFMVVLLCHSMGRHGYLFSPALAVWSPLMVLVPIAYTGIRRVSR